MKNNVLGDLGEQLVIGMLYSQGYSILENQYRCKAGEIDVIAFRENEITFVEVKTRSSLLMGRPSEAVTKDKQRRIRSAAKFYMQSKKMVDIDVNFQVVEVLINQLNFAF